jgi:hypothetical protein
MRCDGKEKEGKQGSEEGVRTEEQKGRGKRERTCLARWQARSGEFRFS